jgi:D-alanyl-D-alanine carboxypeptidase
MRTPVRRLSGLTATLLAIVLVAPTAAPRSAPSIEDALAAIRAYAPRAMAEQGAPGLSVAITDRTRTLAILTLGYANVDAKAPVTPQTRFAIGSITKSMTSLALLEMRDAHRLDLNAPVQRYLPWFSIDSDGKPILVHELLSHTAGIPDDYSASPSYEYGIFVLRRARTLFAPGTAWSYSNDGFATLGAVEAVLDHRSWADSLQERVLAPIGMSRTSAVFTPDTMADAALGYEFRDVDRPAPLHPALIPSRPFDFVDPAGSVLSTPGDMARYLRFYLNGGVTANGTRLVSPQSFAAMTSPDRYLNGKPAGSTSTVLEEAPQFYRRYGFGLAIMNAGGDHIVGHTGGISGYTACMEANLTRGFGVIAMANLVEAPLHPCAIVLYAMRVLRAQSLGEALPAPPPPPNPAYVSNGTDYAGTYVARDGKRVTVDGTHGGVTQIDEGQAYALYPRGGDLFWSSDPRYALFLLHFDRDANHRVVDLTYGSRWFASSRYSGPRSWHYPAQWNAYVGRYEDVFWGSPSVTRVLVVKGVLTLDGLQPLTPQRDGSFAVGPDVVKFDGVAGGKAQRMWFDDTATYRVDLP